MSKAKHINYYSMCVMYMITVLCTMTIYIYKRSCSTNVEVPRKLRYTYMLQNKSNLLYYVWVRQYLRTYPYTSLRRDTVYYTTYSTVPHQRANQPLSKYLTTTTVPI